MSLGGDPPGLECIYTHPPFQYTPLTQSRTYSRSMALATVIMYIHAERILCLASSADERSGAVARRCEGARHCRVFS